MYATKVKFFSFIDQKDKARPPTPRHLARTPKSEYSNPHLADVPDLSFLKLKEKKLDRNVHILTEEGLLDPDVEKDIVNMCRYFEDVGRKEGYFERGKPVEFVIAITAENDKGMTGRHTPGHNFMRIDLGPFVVQSTEGRVLFLKTLFHELRHRVSFTNLQYKIPAEQEAHATLFRKRSMLEIRKSAKHRKGDSFSFEELFTVEFTADNFEDYLESQAPQLVRHYKKIDNRAQQEAMLKKRGKVEDLYGLGTVATTSLEDIERGIQVRGYYEQLFYISRELRRLIPNFSELLARARKGEQGAIGLFCREIARVCGKDVLRSFFVYERVEGESTFAPEERILASLRAIPS